MSISSFITDRRTDISGITRYIEEEDECNFKLACSRNRKRTGSFKPYGACRKKPCLLILKPMRQRKFSKLPVNHTFSVPNYIWHAKRFRTSKVAMSNCSRGFKASQQASLTHSVIQDVSFLSLFLVKCYHHFESFITEIQHHLMDPQNTFQKYAFDRHIILKEMECLLFSYDRFPFGCIGKVKLIVFPTKDILIWMVPCISSQVRSELERIMSEINDGSDRPVTISQPVNYLNRFLLRGPLTAVAVRKLLCSNAQDCAVQFFSNASTSPYLSAIWNFGSILEVDIPDPRLPEQLPRTHDNVNETRPEKNLDKGMILWPKLTMSSSLWNVASIPEFRRDLIINTSKRSESVSAWMSHFLDDCSKVVHDRLNRSNLDISSLRKSTEQFPNCPAALIRTQQILSKRLLKGRAKKSLLSGWDIVVPAVWGPTMWRAFQRPGIVESGKYNRVIAVGEEEMQDINRMHGELSFPKDFPDTEAGRQYWTDRHRLECSVNFNRPRSKRKEVRSLLTILLNVVNWSPVENKPAYETKKIGYEALDCGPVAPCSEEESELLSLVVVRGEAFLRDFLPPDMPPSSRRAAGESTYAARPVDLLASGALQLPNRVMLHVQLLSDGARGLPMDLAELVAPTNDEYDIYYNSLKIMKEFRKARRKGSSSERIDGFWNGVDFAHEETSASRQVVGVVTSGYPRHTNKKHSAKGVFTFAIGLCNAAALNQMICTSFSRNSNPTHNLILFRNPRSGWLRPCSFQIM